MTRSLPMLCPAQRAGQNTTMRLFSMTTETQFCRNWEWIMLGWPCSAARRVKMQARSIQNLTECTVRIPALLEETHGQVLLRKITAEIDLEILICQLKPVDRHDAVSQNVRPAQSVFLVCLTMLLVYH